MVCMIDLIELTQCSEHIWCPVDVSFYLTQQVFTRKCEDIYNICNTICSRKNWEQSNPLIQLS